MSKQTAETLRRDFQKLERNPAYKQMMAELDCRHLAAIDAVANNATAPEPILRAVVATLSVWQTVKNLPEILIGQQEAEDELNKAQSDVDQFDD